jgi:hypothetical protein
MMVLDCRAAKLKQSNYALNALSLQVLIRIDFSGLDLSRFGPQPWNIGSRIGRPHCKAIASGDCHDGGALLVRDLHSLDGPVVNANRKLVVLQVGMAAETETEGLFPRPSFSASACARAIPASFYAGH